VTSYAYKPITQWKKREKFVDDNGYVRVQVPEHPRAFGRGWVYEHRLVAERRLGRLLKTYETVHHINEIKTDNSDKNLFACFRVEHDKAHRLTYAAA